MMWVVLAQGVGDPTGGTGPAFTIMVLLVACVAITAFALAFLAAQRSVGRSPPGVEETMRQVQVLEGLNTDLKRLRNSATRASAPQESLRDMDEALASLDEAAKDLKRAAERVV